MIMVRAPRFEPGSSAWQADVLDQTRLRALGTSVNPVSNKNLTTKTEAKIANTLIQLKANGRTEERTIKRIGTNLTKLAQQCNLDNPEEVKLNIAEMQTIDKRTRQKKKADNQTKNKYASAYNHYCLANGINWKKPYYKIVEKTPLIPTSQDVQAIIDNSSEDYVTVFTIEAEIGCCPEELYQVTQKSINKETGEMSITGVKGHASKNYRLKPPTKDLLLRYLAKHTAEQPFPKAHAQSQMWYQFRAKAAAKLNKPQLLNIALRNLRNYSGERFYKNLPTRDPILLMQHFRHKKLERTMHYIRAIVLDYEEDEQFISRISTTIQEDAKLIENGFQYVTERDGKKLFRKRK
jgi:hypothetical protein